MRTITYLTHLSELPWLEKNNVTEVVLNHRELSRQGTLSTAEVLALATECEKLKIKVYLDWDVLLKTKDLSPALQLIKEITTKTTISALRVMDMGAVRVALKELTLPLHLNLETAHHNWPAISELLDYAQKRVERVIFSLELPKNILQGYIQKIPAHIEAELLGLGPILLFYSPRPLLSTQAFAEIEEQKKYFSEHNELWALGSSEESPHHGFTLLENQHGTLMFLPKHHGLLEEWENLERLGVKILRLDLRLVKNKFPQTWIDFWNAWGIASKAELQASYPFPLIRGFYSVNRTDALFGRLKNSHLEVTTNMISWGTILEVKKGKFVAIKANKNLVPITNREKLSFLHPEGEEIPYNLEWAQDVAGNPLSQIAEGSVFLANYSKALVPGALLVQRV